MEGVIGEAEKEGKYYIDVSTVSLFFFLVSKFLMNIIILYRNSFLKYPGRGDEVRARIKKFNDESFVKGMATITFFILLGFYAKMTNVSHVRIWNMEYKYTHSIISIANHHLLFPTIYF